MGAASYGWEAAQRHDCEWNPRPCEKDVDVVRAPKSTLGRKGDATELRGGREQQQLGWTRSAIEVGRVEPRWKTRERERG